MAKEFVRFFDGFLFGEKPHEPTGSALIPVDPEPAAAPQQSSQSPLRLPTFVTKNHLAEVHGDAVAEALYQIVQQDRQKAAQKFREMHQRLMEIRTTIAAKHAQIDVRLGELQRTADAAYARYLAACAELEALRTQGQSEIAPLAHEAEGIVKALNVPVHANQVKQWLPSNSTVVR